MATERIHQSKTTITRRAILAGIPASAVVAAVVTHSALANTASGPDAELLAMIDQWQAKIDRQLSLSGKADELRFCIRLEVPFPRILKRRLQEAPTLNDAPIKDWRRIPMSRGDIEWRYRNKPAKRMAALAALEAWEDEVKGRLALTDWPALEAEHARVLADQGLLFDRIMATRAMTPAGMLAKLDTYLEPITEPECASVYDDLRVLCGLAPSASLVVEG